MAARRRGLYDVNSYIEVEIDFFDPTWRFQGNWFQIFFEFKNLSDEILIIELKDVQPGTPKGPLMTTPIILPEYHNWSFPLFIQFNQKKLPPFLKIMGILKGRSTQAVSSAASATRRGCSNPPQAQRYYTMRWA